MTPETVDKNLETPKKIDENKEISQDLINKHIISEQTNNTPDAKIQDLTQEILAKMETPVDTPKAEVTQETVIAPAKKGFFSKLGSSLKKFGKEQFGTTVEDDVNQILKISKPDAGGSPIGFTANNLEGFVKTYNLGEEGIALSAKADELVNKLKNTKDNTERTKIQTDINNIKFAFIAMMRKNGK